MISPFPSFSFSPSANRIEEMKQRSKREIHGSIYQIREPEFVSEVSKAPSDTYVVLHLFSQKLVG